MKYPARTTFLITLLLFIAVAAVYRLWVTTTFSGDDLQYTMVIQRSVLGDTFYHPAGGQAYLPGVEELRDLPVPPTLNPRYLLEWPTSAAVAGLWKIFGWEGSSITPIQTLRIVVGALGIVAFFLALNKLTADYFIAGLCSLGLAVGVAYWTYSTHPDQSINMTALLCAAFYVLVWQYQDGFTMGRMALLIALLVLASLYNFTAVLSAFAFGIGVALMSRPQAILGRALALVRFGAIYAVVVIVIILGTVAIVESPSSVFSADYWRRVTFGGKPEYNVSPVSDAGRAALGLAKSQVLFFGVKDSVRQFFDNATGTQRLLLIGYYLVILALISLPFLLLLRYFRQLGRDQIMFVFLICWLVTHSLFNWFWDPGFDKYWLVPLMVCWAATALALKFLRERMPRLFRPARFGVGLFVAVSFGFNLMTQFLPESRADQNAWLQIAQDLQSSSSPSDLFITYSHPIDFYIAYFTRRDIVAAGLIGYDQGGDQSQVSSIIESHIQAHRADGGNVYVYGLEQIPDETQRAGVEGMLDGELEVAWEYPDLTIYRVIES